MTTYDALKEKQASAKASASSHAKQKAKNPPAALGYDRLSSDSKRAGRSISAETRKDTAPKSVSVRRDRSHSKSEMIRTSKIPEIFGLAQKRVFETKKAQAVSKYPLAVSVAVILTVTFMFMMLVVNAVGINNMKTRTTELNVELEGLIEKKEELDLELEKRDDLRYIEEIAKNQYGMIKKDYVTKYYINSDNEDKIEVIDKSVPPSSVVDEKAE